MFKRLIGLAAATVAVAGLGMAGVASADAAVVHAKPANTGSCGTSCVEPYFLDSGTQFVEGMKSTAGLESFVGLQNRTTLNYLLDFAPVDSGTVVPEYCPEPGVPGSTAVDPIFTANQCNALINDGYESDTAWQLRYTPLGTYTPLCVSTYGDGKPKVGARVRLADCGVTASSIWIGDSANSVGSTMPYINGGSSNYSDPLVIHELSGAPKAQGLDMQPLNVDTHGIVDGNELVGLLPGL